MLRPSQLILLLILLPFYACHNSNKYPYAIKDFPKKLQPHLIKMVEKGIVIGRDRSLQKMATDEDLEKLGQSEHPILRTAAFREMLERESINHFNIIMAHLDDTALVFVDMGEFGIEERTVSDDILKRASWKTLVEKNKTVELVLTRHNYLQSAYLILKTLPPQEKYYAFVKDMATRPRQVDDFELAFNDIEYALYGLAKFNKKKDVSIIKQKMMGEASRLSKISFKLMKEFPDTAYFDVLQRYHRRKFYSSSNFSYDRADREEFIQALAVQQSNKSAGLLDTMLKLIPLKPCLPNSDVMMDEIVMAIWNHPCPAYTAIRKKIKAKAEESLKWNIEIPIDPSFIPSTDTTTAPFGWNY